MESYAHHAFCVPLYLKLSNPLRAHQSQDEDGTTVCAKGKLFTIVIQGVAVDVFPLFGHHLDFCPFHVPQTYLLVVAVHQFFTVFGQYEYAAGARNPDNVGEFSSIGVHE